MQGDSRKTSTSASLTMLKPLCGSQQTGKFLKSWGYQTTKPASWENCMQVKKQQLELDMEQRLVQNWERTMSVLCIVTLLISLIFKMTDFIFLGSKIAGDRNCSHKIKTLAAWKKSYDKPRQCIKSRDIILPTKVHVVKAVVFPGVMYRCDSWTIKKAEHQKIDAFELCQGRFSWIARRSS